MQEKIVVTGMGAVTPIGIGVDTFWDNLISGKCGIEKITRYDVTDWPVQIAGEVKDFHPEEIIGKKLMKEMDLFMQYAFVAAEEALKDQDLQTEPERIGIVLGTAFNGVSTLASTQDELSRGVHSKVSPRFIPKIIGNIGAAQIAIAKGFRGPSITVETACSSGGDAISQAAMILKSGMADVVLAVGAEAALCPVIVQGLVGARALSTNNEHPELSSRPFDQDRDGFVIGEGGGCIILETEEHAKKRNAKIYAELAGVANCTDGYHVTSPHPEGIGAAFCMEKSMEMAGCQPTDVDYINTHGTSTHLGDTIEVNAIKKVFGEHAYQMSISSTKGSTGHLMGAGGVVETIACIQAVRTGVVPPTHGLYHPDPECDLDFTPINAVKKEINVAMSNSFGFGGQNSSVIVRKYHE